MTHQAFVIIGVFAVICLILTVFLVRVWLLVRRINASFAKLGFIMREDAKKYFEDAANKIVETNEQFQQNYQKIVEDGTRAVLQESTSLTEKAIADAHVRANEIVLRARTDAQQIIKGAELEANQHAEKTLQRTGDAIGWVMSQYLGEVYSTEAHEALIEQQVRKYVNEHRK